MCSSSSATSPGSRPRGSVDITQAMRVVTPHGACGQRDAGDRGDEFAATVFGLGSGARTRRANPTRRCNHAHAIERARYDCTGSWLLGDVAKLGALDHAL